MQDFRDLKVWQKGHELSLLIYKTSRSFPNDERFGLTNQVRSACASIPANIAEGCGRGTDKEFAQFLQIAMGSACETEYFLLLAKELKYFDDICYGKLQHLIVEVKKMLASFIQKLRRK